MAGNDDQGGEKQDAEDYAYEEGYDGYEETTVNPGQWMFLGTAIFCFSVMLVIVPLMVCFRLRKRKNKEQDTAAEPFTQTNKEEIPLSTINVLRPDKETRKILKLAIPYSLSALMSSTFANICLVLVSQKIGIKSVAAYALCGILLGLTDGCLSAPIYACTTLCAQATGAGNTHLAGQYIQLALTFYAVLQIPAILFWNNFMYDVIMYLEWGDVVTAQIAQEFTYIYIWSFVLGGISGGIWQLLEVADHAVAGTIVSILWGGTNVVVISYLVNYMEDVSLNHVGYAYIATGVLFIMLTLAISLFRGWLKPFYGGLFRSLAIRNFSAIKLLMKQAIPLGFGALLSNAEWAVLTFFASHLGPAEVAAWSLLGSLWEVFYTVTAGIGDAAEIRVAYHLGDNHPTMARLSAFKSLLLGMLVSSVVSILFFAVQRDIPAWYTSDETLQGMLAELMPYVGVANLTMTFGMQCWSLIGAQGKYKLATWINFLSSWGICMPLAAIYCLVFNFDLQGLTSAVVLGYVSTGACLSYVLLSTDWFKVARKIKEQNAAYDDMSDEDRLQEELFASMKYNSIAAKLAARRNIRLLTVPPGYRSGVLLGNVYGKAGTYVLMVRNWSPLAGRVKPGDAIVALDGVDVSKEDAHAVSHRLKTARDFDRELVIVAPQADIEDAEDGIMFSGVAEDESFDSKPKGPPGLYAQID